MKKLIATGAVKLHGTWQLVPTCPSSRIQLPGLRMLFLSLAIAFFQLTVSAQTATGSISGRVHNEEGQALHNVTVSLLQAADSSLVKLALTDKQGRYEFLQLSTGHFLLQYTMVGMQPATRGPVTLSAANPKQEIPELNLQTLPKDIAAVTVVAKRPFIETKIDRTIVNVEASPTNAGATALEVLEKSPGVMVNNDGAISLRGKAGVIVMMDGKQTFLSPTDLANLLRNLPASSLDQIEIMTNPSSKYDAAGNSGIINIKTKKGQKGGFNGSVMVGVTTGYFEANGNLYVTPKSQNSINFNYRRNKINFYGNYNPNFMRGRSQLEINRRVMNDAKETTGYVDVITQFKFRNNNHNLKLGLDYFADKKNSFGVALSGFQFNGFPSPTTITSTSDENRVVNSQMVSLTDNRIRFRNLSANFNYRHVFDTTGRELTSDFDFITYDNLSRMDLSTRFYDGNGQETGNPLLLNGHLPSKIDIYSFKADYVQPFRKGGRMEAGIKGSYVSNDNIVDYSRWVVDKWLPDARSNHFQYEETILAAYLNGNHQIGKWSFQGGLRLENTLAKGYQVTNDSSFRRDFTNLFPSVFLSYELSKKHQLTVAYSRRILRPNYQDLNPFIYFLDSLSYRKGNPFLTPQFTHNFELTHSFQGKLISTVNYTHTNDVIANIVRPEDQILFLTSENVAKFRNIGLAITAPLPITKWWNLNLFANLFNNRYKGVYENEPLDIAYTSFMINMTQTFTLKQGFTAELSGFYRARSVDQLSINEPMYVISAGAQKNVMKGKGTLRFNLRDPLWLQRYKGKTQYNLVDSRVANRWDNRQITVSFTYRFGKNGQQNPPPRKRNSAAQEELNRVGQG